MSTDQPPPDDSSREQPPAAAPYGSPPPAEGGGRYGGPPESRHPADAAAPVGGRPRQSYGDSFGEPDPLAGMPPLGGLGRRLLARIIDELIIIIPVDLIIGFSAGAYDPTADSSRYTSLTMVSGVVYFLYEGLMLSSGGQTVGKKAMGLRVAMLRDGAIPAGQPAWGRAATYSLPQVVPCLGTLFWLINVLWCTWDRPYRQCVHDKVARTVVVSTR